MPDHPEEQPTAKLRVRPPGEVDDLRLDFVRLPIRRHYRRLLSAGFIHQFVLVRAPGDVRPPHEHDYDAQVHVLKGELTIGTPPASDTVYEGQEKLVPAGTTHTETTGPEGVILLVGCR